MSDNEKFVETAKAVAQDEPASLASVLSGPARARRSPDEIEEDGEDGVPATRTAGDLLFFKDIIERTKQVFTRTRIVQASATRTEKTMADPPAAAEATVPLNPRIGTIRIVCVRSELDIYSRRDVSLQDFRDGCKLLRANDNFDGERWVKARLKELDDAIALDPHVICFPEFAYPPPSAPLQGGWTLEEISEAVGRRAEFERQALERLGDRKTFLFLGSFHCPMSLYNVGVVYPWGSHEHGTEHFTKAERFGDRGSKVVEMPDFRHIRAPVMHRKRFPARKVGEQTRVPAGRGFNVYECAFGKIMVLICSDILDINQFMTIVREGTSQQDIDMVLVPAYNPAAGFGRIARDLSNLAATMVVVANAADPEFDLTRPDIFICGEMSNELAASEWDEKHTVLTDHQVDESGRLYHYDIDMDQLGFVRAAHIERLGLEGRPRKGSK